jgi:hypothetical protein
MLLQKPREEIALAKYGVVDDEPSTPVEIPGRRRLRLSTTRIVVADASVLINLIHVRTAGAGIRIGRCDHAQELF